MPLASREEMEARYGQMVAEQRAREAAAAQQISQNVGGATRGLGTGLMDQVRDFRNLAQKVGQIAGNYINDIAMMRDPTRNLPGYTELSAMGEAAVDPQTYINMGKDIYRQATTSPESLGRLIGQNINPLNMVRNLRPVMAELDVYHGTPHRFPATEANPLGEFDASKIGTGEGAQAFGHGIYLAENPNVAKSYIRTPQDWAAQANVKGSTYRNAQAEIAKIERELRQKYSAKIPKNEVSAFMYAEQNADKFDPQLVDRIKSARQAEEKAYKDFSSGAFYRADLPDEMIDRMLDWDKPLRDQPENVKRAFNYQGNYKGDVDEVVNSLRLVADNDYNLYQMQGKVSRLLERYRKNPDNPKIRSTIEDYFHAYGDESGSYLKQMEAQAATDTGKHLLRELVQQKGEQGAAEHLRSLGIPGVRYLDAGSRGGEGTRNFVVFPGEEKRVKILERK